MLKRFLQLPPLVEKKSFFLFGPRATGKSSLIQQQLGSSVLVIDLLRSELFLRLSAHPEELEPIIAASANTQLVVIDEVQKVPILLNEVHRLIEEKKIHFLLTGSSGRKLKNSGVNLLAGRAWVAELFPLTRIEIPNFDLDRYLHFGGLPPVYLSDEPEEELFAYVETYLKEEIQAESLIRKIPAFSRFLEMSALTSGEVLNFSEIASDTGIPATSIREYYHVLEDTFIGFMLPAWKKTVKRKPVSTAKFYYFDLGVRNTLAKIKQIEEKSDAYGRAFEHFMALEIRAYLSYSRAHLDFSYWRSKHGAEVDFIIGDNIAIEVKATKKVSEKHLKGLRLLSEENICEHYYLVSHDPIPRKYGCIHVIHWEDFLNRIWRDEIT